MDIVEYAPYNKSFRKASYYVAVFHSVSIYSTNGYLRKILLP